MIVVNAKFQVKPAKRAEFLSAVKTLIAQTKTEAGNLAYDLYQAVDDENSFVMIENWEDEAAAKAHSQSATFIEFTKQSAEFAAAAPEMQISKV